MSDPIIELYSSGNKVINPWEFPVDRERIYLIQEAKKTLEAIGELTNHSSRSKRSRIKHISQLYANDKESEDVNDTKNLKGRMEIAWETACLYNFASEGITNAAIVNIARVLTYVNNQRTPHSYRNLESMTPPRLLDNNKHLEGLMKEMIDNANSIKQPLIKALYTQFEIYYLQPAINGNKRLGQIVAWKIMDEHGYPLHFVPPTEFEYYTKLMNDACIAVDGKMEAHHFAKAVGYMLERVSFSLELVKESKKIRDPTEKDRWYKTIFNKFKKEYKQYSIF